ncbi:hypothetical protein [Streptomyces wuyuanensis]
MVRRQQAADRAVRPKLRSPGHASNDLLLGGQDLAVEAGVLTA